MVFRILLLFIFILLSNCATSPTAFLGPVFTGAKTGSIYQASLSYGSNKLISTIRKQPINFMKNKKFNTSVQETTLLVTSAYKVDEVKFSELIEEEPLP